MKSTFISLAILLVSGLANATVQEGQIYFVPVESAKYQLASGKQATTELQIGFLSKTDAEAASQNIAKIKTAIQTTLKDSKTNVATKTGKMILGAEVAAKLQDSGIKAQTVLWNSFLF